MPTSAQRRRRIATVAGLVGAEFGVLGLRQLGLIGPLPDPPLPGFDADAVMRAPVAYPFGVPDSLFAVAGCASIVALAAAPRPTARHRRWLDRALRLASAVGAAAAGFYVTNMIFVQRKLCIYCLAAATGLFAIAAQAVPLKLRDGGGRA